MDQPGLPTAHACRDLLLSSGFSLNYDYDTNFFVARDGVAVGVAVERSGRVNCEVKRWHQSEVKGKSHYKSVSKVSLPPGKEPEKVAAWVLEWVAFVS